MRLTWTPAAAADLKNISDYLGERHPRFRRPTVRKLYASIRCSKIRRASDARVENQEHASSYFRPCITLPCPGKRRPDRGLAAFITVAETHVARRWGRNQSALLFFPQKVCLKKKPIGKKGYGKFWVIFSRFLVFL